MKRQIYKTAFYGTIGLLMFASCSCNGTKNTSRSKTNQEVNIENKEIPKFESTFNISARSQLFIKAVEDEMSSTESNIETYEPSGELVQQYGLKKQNEEHIIRGFIKTTSSFEKINLESKGVNIGRKTGEMMTISFPLSFLQEFLASDNITYFEISEQVTPK
jgi:hypothetical protein